ncbi:unnamed protein product [Meloidogyne enterolobii]|uniref:Uncharacterized protein n=1 Tax=Meloidogyne enterolobii TaxID=390850 RepID=A0ACB1A9S0_MELEN
MYSSRLSANLFEIIPLKGDTLLEYVLLFTGVFNSSFLKSSIGLIGLLLSRYGTKSGTALS